MKKIIALSLVMLAVSGCANNSEIYVSKSKKPSKEAISVLTEACRTKTKSQYLKEDKCYIVNGDTLVMEQHTKESLDELKQSKNGKMAFSTKVGLKQAFEMKVCSDPSMRPFVLDGVKVRMFMKDRNGQVIQDFTVENCNY